ncbi:hypothetical protein [Paenibacillus sp. GCM10027626]|uniref:hypothetical protein n=1 Tax=Paenibacillus sp. GCM10027626 TaxID=3273411 RepID=UPI00363EDAF8
MQKKVDREQLHTLFMSGMSPADIANQLGITKRSCITLISRERKKSPSEWPLRHGESDIEPPLMMHLYECTYCFAQFAVEDYEEIDHSATVCPICQTEEHVEDAGYGRFIVTINAE